MHICTHAHACILPSFPTQHKTQSPPTPLKPQAGETYEENAYREAEEELGIKGVPMTHLFNFYYEVGIGIMYVYGGLPQRCCRAGRFAL